MRYVSLWGDPWPIRAIMEHWAVKMLERQLQFLNNKYRIQIASCVFAAMGYGGVEARLCIGDRSNEYVVVRVTSRADGSISVTPHRGSVSGNIISGREDFAMWLRCHLGSDETRIRLACVLENAKREKARRA